MFARNVKSVFDRLIPRQAKLKKTVSPHKKHFYPGDKVLFKAYKNKITFWEVGTIKQRIGELVYIVQGPKNIHKHHMNQLRKCRLNESEESPQNTYEELIDVIFDHFDLDTSQVSREVRRLGRKKNVRYHYDVEEEVLTIFFPFSLPKKEKKTLGRWGVVNPKPIGIMVSSSTILLREITLSESSNVIPKC